MRIEQFILFNNLSIIFLELHIVHLKTSFVYKQKYTVLDPDHIQRLHEVIVIPTNDYSMIEINSVSECRITIWFMQILGYLFFSKFHSFLRVFFYQHEYRIMIYFNKRERKKRNGLSCLVYILFILTCLI
jgi:hypothetical protein